jgi:hypothetical protein
MDERIGSVGWVLSKGITPTRSGNAGQGQEAVWKTYVRIRLFATITMASLANRDARCAATKRRLWGQERKLQTHA